MTLNPQAQRYLKTAERELKCGQNKIFHPKGLWDFRNYMG
jgi:hypothetical protein